MPSHNKHIYLIGFSGSGKSTVGPQLAKRMKRPFVDIDQRIARRMRRTIPDIFAEIGEKAFRVAEQETIARTARTGRPGIIAVGGGAFESAASRDLMQQSGIVVYLSCARREIYRRLRAHSDRPMLAAGKDTAPQAVKQRISSLLDRRLKNYRRADITVATTTRQPGEVVDQIIRKLDAVND